MRTQVGVTGLFVGMVCAVVAVGGAERTEVTLERHAYQSLTAPPFNGQVAFYVEDVESTEPTARRPIRAYVLVGNGRRPFTVPSGSMKPEQFKLYTDRLGRTDAVTVFPFQIRASRDRTSFTYLRRSYSVQIAHHTPCQGCPGRIVLTIR